MGYSNRAKIIDIKNAYKRHLEAFLPKKHSEVWIRVKNTREMLSPFVFSANKEGDPVLKVRFYKNKQNHIKIKGIEFCGNENSFKVMTRICKGCGKTIIRGKQQRSKTNLKFCNEDCYYTYLARSVVRKRIKKLLKAGIKAKEVIDEKKRKELKVILDKINYRLKQGKKITKRYYAKNLKQAVQLFHKAKLYEIEAMEKGKKN